MEQIYYGTVRNITLTHWGRVTHICVGKLTIIGSDDGLSLGRRQAIIWTNAGILLIGSLGTNVSEILIGIQTFSFKKMHLKMSSGKWRPFCLGLNVLILQWRHMSILASRITAKWTVYSGWHQGRQKSSTLLVLCDRNPLGTYRFPNNVESDMISKPIV